MLRLEIIGLVKKKKELYGLNFSIKLFLIFMYYLKFRKLQGKKVKIAVVLDKFVICMLDIINRIFLTQLKKQLFLP